YWSEPSIVRNYYFSYRGEPQHWREQVGRLGVIIPSSNTVSERDFVREAPAGVSVHSARAYLAETTAEAERRMLDEFVPQAARDLGTARVDLTIFSCTSAAALLGKDGESQLIGDLEQLTGAPVVSTNH